MRSLILAACFLLGASAAHADDSFSKGWRVGLDFEQQVFSRTGLRTEKVFSDSGNSVGVTIGSQFTSASTEEGTTRLRKVVDYGAYFHSGLAITPILKSRVGVQAGYMTFHNGASTDTTGAGYFDIMEGFGVTYGKVEFFTDLAYRTWYSYNDKQLLLGDRPLDRSYVYPRLGFIFSL